MHVRPAREVYEFVDFRKEESPIPYNDVDFPRGLHSVEILYRDGKPYRVYFYGAVDSVKEIKEPACIEKILEFIENRLEEQAAEPAVR